MRLLCLYTAAAAFRSARPPRRLAAPRRALEGVDDISSMDRDALEAECRRLRVENVALTERDPTRAGPSTKASRRRRGGHRVIYKRDESIGDGTRVGASTGLSRAARASFRNLMTSPLPRASACAGLGARTPTAPFSLDDAALCAGFAFECYNDPDTGARWERGADACDVAFRRPSFVRACYAGALLVRVVRCKGLKNSQDLKEMARARAGFQTPRGHARVRVAATPRPRRGSS